jgi:4-oxalomesaconate tautomerase
MHNERSWPTGIRCMIMRGGTSKGAYFLAEDLPSDVPARDRVLLEIMGSPDSRQIDGIGGAHPLTSKVAIVSRAANDSADNEADVDYLFLQVNVDEAIVSDKQNCGNLLAGVGPFAIERGLVTPTRGDMVGRVRVRMINTGGVAVVTFPLVDGMPTYDGDCAIAGVPGTAAPIELAFSDTAGSTCGSLLPTGNITDVVNGIEVTCIDNGMPVVILRAESLGVTGKESCAELEANTHFRTQLEALRLACGPLMNLGDVAKLTVPKMTLVSTPSNTAEDELAATICTRTFIPHRCHDAIGVLGAVSVATASLIEGTPAFACAGSLVSPNRVSVEHPTGILDATVAISFVDGEPWAERSAILRTARKLMDGTVFARTPFPQTDPISNDKDGSHG